MNNLSATELVHRAIGARLLTHSDVEFACSTIDISTIEFQVFTIWLINRELLTNFQIARLIRGEVDGFIYGKYKIKYLIGIESLARVYRAVKLDTQHDVKLKVLRGCFKSDTVAKRDFEREAGRIGAKTAIYQNRMYFVIDPSPN